MAKLDHSVRGFGDTPFIEIQEIARNNHKILQKNCQLIARFRQLCSTSFTFVQTWDNPAINASTFRLFSKKVPALEVAQDYTRRVHRQFAGSSRQLLTKTSVDTQKSRFAHEWSQAAHQTTRTLEERLKEPHELLFFKGAIYECTYNQEGKFSASQKSLVYDVPSEDEIDQWKNVKVLLAPSGCKEVVYNPNFN